MKKRRVYMTVNVRAGLVSTKEPLGNFAMYMRTISLSKPLSCTLLKQVANNIFGVAFSLQVHISAVSGWWNMMRLSQRMCLYSTVASLNPT